MSAVKQSFKQRGATAWVDGVEYTGFTVSSLPKRFGFIYNPNEDQEGLCSWFNRGGYTFIRNSDLKSGC